VIYNVAIRVRGIAEPRDYGAACTRSAGSTAPAQGTAAVDMLCTGDSPPPAGGYNVFELEIENNPPVATQPRYVRFNSVPAGGGQPDYVYLIDETYTAKVRPGTMLTLRQTDANCLSTMNCGAAAADYTMSNAACRAAARQIADITLPPTYRGGAYPATSNGPNQPFQAQFLNLRVTSMGPM
jgi:hypothetical protein